MRRYLPNLTFFLCLILACAIYYPGTHGYFQFDDNANILENAYIKISTIDLDSLAKVANSGAAGPFKRPISVVSFALNYYFTGTDPYFFKLTNIIIHLMNGVGIFWLSRLLVNANNIRNPVTADFNNQQWVACAIAAAWLLHPLNLGGVLYIVQRMTSLAAMFTICGLISYLTGRARQQQQKQGWPWILASFFIFTPLSLLSKENGALLPPLLLLIEFVFYRFKSDKLATQQKLLALFAMTVLIPLIVVMLYTAFNPAWLVETYKIREFTLAERCMTEARAIFFYLRLLIAPDISQFAMYHDDIATSHGLLDPVSTIFSIVGLCALLLGAIASLKRHPVVAFGIGFFLLGHSMESSIIPLELVHEHRNYLPDFGILFILFYYLLSPSSHIKSLKARRYFAVLLVVTFALLTLSRSLQWGDPVKLREKEVERHPNSARANIEIASLYAHIPATSKENADQLYARAFQYYSTTVVVSPSDTLGLFGLINLNARNSLPLEPFWIPELAKRVRTFPFAVWTGNSIQDLNNCFMEHTCAVEADAVEAIIRAALDNKTLTPSQRTQLYFVWAAFLFDTKHQADIAAKYTLQGAELSDSDLIRQINAITLLVNIQKPQDALMLINKTRTKDKFNIYSKLLDNLRDAALSTKQ